MLGEFFQFYAYEFDYHDAVVSVRTGRFLTKVEKQWTGAAAGSESALEDASAVSACADAATAEKVRHAEPAGKSDGDDIAAGDGDAAAAARKPPPERTLLCIEDPFEITHNLGRMVGRQSLHAIRGEFMRAWRILVDGIEPPANIFQPLK